ncbi:MAG TPA: hypothetical protein VF544_18925 [Pyrinomonadaceae bacterium]|jgi:hypothetical protein
MSQSSDGQTKGHTLLTDERELWKEVWDVMDTTPVLDMHTHLFAPQFEALNLWGIDELLTYHYLIAELFRSHTHITPEQFWKLPKPAQADLVWETLFVRETPLSEATRGVVAVLTSLGLDARARDLSEARQFFRAQKPSDYLDRVLELAGVSAVVMTNDPFDEKEREVWQNAGEIDRRFHAALRIDPLLIDWPSTAPKIAAQGFAAHAELSSGSVTAARSFLDQWIGRMGPLYLAVSLPDDFNFPTDASPLRAQVLSEVILPTCREHDLPFAMMIGVRRGVNPRLRVAGDGLGRADVRAVERICAAYPEVRFLVTLLSRENQHELCVSARKFSNLMPFGCWWFLNNPSIIAEVTQERVELLGTSFVAQHSDARVLDQLIYKWKHSRRVISDVLSDAYGLLLRTGRAVTRAEIERDARRLFQDNFSRFVNLQ